MKLQFVILWAILAICLGWSLFFVFAAGSFTLALLLVSMLLLTVGMMCQSRPAKCKPLLTVTLLALVLLALLGFSASMLFMPVRHPLILF